MKLAVLVHQNESGKRDCLHKNIEEVSMREGENLFKPK